MSTALACLAHVTQYLKASRPQAQAPCVALFSSSSSVCCIMFSSSSSVHNNATQKEMRPICGCTSTQPIIRVLIHPNLQINVTMVYRNICKPKLKEFLSDP